TAAEGGPLQRVTFPGVVVILNQQPGTPPPVGGTVGTVVNHVGFIVKDVQGSVAKWKAAGVPVLPGNNNRLDQAYVVTADGLRIKTLKKKTKTRQIRHEHVHFFRPEAEMAKSQAWYGTHFGAKASTRNNALVADVPGAQLRFAKATEPQKT